MSKALLVTIALALLASVAADPDPQLLSYYGGYPYSAALVAAAPMSPALPYAYSGYSSAYQVQNWGSAVAPAVAPVVAPSAALTALPYTYSYAYPYYKR